jgi:hypothetical protein
VKAPRSHAAAAFDRPKAAIVKHGASFVSTRAAIVKLTASFALTNDEIVNEKGEVVEEEASA